MECESCLVATALIVRNSSSNLLTCSFHRSICFRCTDLTTDAHCGSCDPCEAGYKCDATNPLAAVCKCDAGSCSALEGKGCCGGRYVFIQGRI